MTKSRIFAAGLAALLAAPAVAQSRAGDAASRAAGREPAAQAPAAAPAPGGPGAQAQAQAAPGEAAGSQHQRLVTALSDVLAFNDYSVRIGDLAATRATTPDLQNLGRKVAEDHRRIGEELTRLLAARNITPAQANLPAQVRERRERLDKEYMQLAALSGAEFDRAATEFLTTNAPIFVDNLKIARDATPGKDGQLKKFLDEAENVEEEHRNAAREVKSQRRQARTPPRQ